MLMLMYEVFSDYWGGAEIFGGGWWGSCVSLFRAGEAGKGSRVKGTVVCYGGEVTDVT